MVAAIIASGVLYNRNIFAVPDQSYLQVFLWQFLAWLPWAIIIPFTRKYLDQEARPPISWIIVSFLVAFGCTIWFIIISDLISPYLDEPQTMFGLYKWFLIFWFTVSFLFFWAHIGFYLLQTRPIQSADVMTQAEDQSRIAIWHNGTHIVVAKTEVIWIEAKDYYAQIHLENGQAYWVKMRLNQLMNELASDRFVRTHRAAMINIYHLEKIDRNEDQSWKAVMRGGHHVRLSRAGKTRLEEALSLIR